MRALMMAAVMTIGCGAAEAQSIAAGNFLNQASNIESDTFTAKEWVPLLGRISKDCGMQVDLRALNAWEVQMRHRDSQFVYIMRDVRPDEEPHANNFQTYWNALVKEDKGVACELADDLWGDMGQHIPGILAK